VIRIQRRHVWCVRMVVVLCALVVITFGWGGPIGPPASAGTPLVAPITTPLATSLQSSSGTWATLPMGHLNEPLNTFWQLFYRPTGVTTWSDKVEATATATNGGLVLAAAAGQPFIAAVRPTNLLHFSPIIHTSDGGRAWANGLLPGGLSARPDALSSAPTGQTLAIVDRGPGTAVLASDGSLSTWRTLTTSAQLASGTAGKTCGLQVLTAVVSWTNSPVVGANCTRPGVVGMFQRRAKTWQLDPLTLPGSLAEGRVEVLSLGQTPYGLDALLGITEATGSAVVAAWTTSQGGWSISPPLALAAHDHIVSYGSASGVGLFSLTASSSGAERLAVIDGPGATWHTLPALPPDTATVAFGPTSASVIDALAAHDTTMTVWTLASASSDWLKGQVLPVKIEYGSSS
jgi:hypothetical protein